MVPSIANSKVMGMARSLGLGGGAPAPSDNRAFAPHDHQSPAPVQVQPPAAGGQPDGLGALLGGLQNMDPKMLSGLMGLLGAYNGGNDQRDAVLLSLKPYLRNERQAKLDRVSQMMRLARTARVGWNTFFGGDKNA